MAPPGYNGSIFLIVPYWLQFCNYFSALSPWFFTDRLLLIGKNAKKKEI